MKAIILLGTLKKEGLSNTETLCEFLSERMSQKDIDCETIKLVNYNILPGTYTDMGAGDEWAGILDKILDADIVVFATPIWWGGHSSEMQKVIERLDHRHDRILEGKKSGLEGKTGGIVITGDSDGAQHIIGNVGNFFNAVGIALPPFATLSVLWEKQKKGAKTSKEELLKKYQEEYTKTANTMVEQLANA
jgi:multimeric flavodoxin WrbA